MYGCRKYTGYLHICMGKSPSPPFSPYRCMGVPYGWILHPHPPPPTPLPLPPGYHRCMGVRCALDIISLVWPCSYVLDIHQMYGCTRMAGLLIDPVWVSLWLGYRCMGVVWLGYTPCTGCPCGWDTRPYGSPCGWDIDVYNVVWLDTPNSHAMGVVWL